MTRLKAIISFSFSLIIISAVGQGLTNFNVELHEITIPNMPGLQSFAWGKTTDGKWLLLGGRTDGMHDHRPPFSFPSSLANQTIYVVDPDSKQVWSSSISSLASGLKNALSSTNMEFEQVGDVLYLIGGYGVNVTTNQHETFSTITAVNITPLANAIIMNQSIPNHFRQITDSRFRVTGGYLHRIGQDFYLVGGQNFDGRYNPHNGPSFTQTYTESIKRFNINDNGSTFQIVNYSETKDAVNLHRRDYNMAPQIFPNGDTGLTVFSGVFQDIIDIPFFNTVDIRDSGYAVRNNFSQLLNQYHTAHATFFDDQNNNMHTVFFGGISMYYYDQLGVLQTDSMVPNVKTISRITRFANDSMIEINMPVQMPGYLGAGAEFIPSDSVSFFSNHIVDLNNTQGRSLAGYVVGGIENTSPHVFMFAGGSTQSSNRIFKVYIKPGTVGIEEPVMGPFQYKVYPNPSKGHYTLTLTERHVKISLFNDIGEKLQEINNNSNSIDIDITHLPDGIYYLNLSNGSFAHIVTLVKAE